MATSSQSEYARVWDKLHESLTREEWKGFDPYDGLNSPLAKLFPFKTARQAWIQFHKRSPINVRPLLGIQKHVNPKALALGISALCVRYRSLGHVDLLGEAVSLEKQLLRLRSTQAKHIAWGYPFDWQSRAFLCRRATPNMICTVFGAAALTDLYESAGQRACLDAAVDACEFIRQELPRTQRGDSFCFSYTPLDRSCVHNVNMLGAAALARVGSLAEKREWLDEAKLAMRFSVEAQDEAGRWPYGEADNQRWVDSFHTGYNLVALKEYQDATGDTDFEESLQRGWKFYRDHFFLDDGTPKYYDAATYPIDIHNAAQGILTFVDVGGDREGAELIAQWAMREMWDERGHFRFQKTRLWTVRIPYLRWAGAWMLLSLAKLLQLAR